jgi:hypothetical protein
MVKNRSRQDDLLSSVGGTRDPPLGKNCEAKDDNTGSNGLFTLISLRARWIRGRKTEQPYQNNNYDNGRVPWNVMGNRRVDLFQAILCSDGRNPMHAKHG